MNELIRDQTKESTFIHARGTHEVSRFSSIPSTIVRSPYFEIFDLQLIPIPHLQCFTIHESMNISLSHKFIVTINFSQNERESAA
jgi:hypothetical protein